MTVKTEVTAAYLPQEFTHTHTHTVTFITRPIYPSPPQKERGREKADDQEKNSRVKKLKKRKNDKNED
jgi:hypothetical protein